MGGEKWTIRFARPRLMGSPPHGRGKVVPAEQLMGETGITPAWAGKSHKRGRHKRQAEDHPRMGGEKLFFNVCNQFVIGSPPHGRGKEITDITEWPTNRITPAWAGKSYCIFVMPFFQWDHPRMGGEKLTVFKFCCMKIGSPPHGRGKVQAVSAVGEMKGITPAWAGKRLKRSHRSGIFISGPIPFHSVLHRPAGSGGSRAGRDGAPAGQPQNAGPA